MRRTMMVLTMLAPLTGSLGAQTLTVASKRAASDKPTLSVFVDGNVKNAVGGSNTSTAVVSGALGLQYIGSFFRTTGQINIAAKTDTLSAGFGTALLSPGSGKAFNSGLIDIRTRTLGTPDCRASGEVQCRFGLHGYASASTTRWATATQEQTVTGTIDVPVIGSGIGAFFSFFDGRIVGADTTSPHVSMVLDATLTHRNIAGDISADDQALMTTIGTTRRHFFGGEFGLSLSYNQMRAGLSYYRMNGGVKGFSRGQIVAGFALKANLLNGTFEE